MGVRVHFPSAGIFPPETSLDTSVRHRIVDAFAPPAGRFRFALAAALPLRLVQFAAALGLYLSFEWLSFLHEFEGVPVTPWNPGLGVIFALLILWGPRSGLLLFAGVVLAEWLVVDTRFGWGMVLAVAATIALPYTIAAAAMRTLDMDRRLQRLRDVVILLLGGTAAAVVVSLGLAGLLVLDPQIERIEIGGAALQLVVGDLIGLSVMTPLVLRLAHARFAELRELPGSGVLPEILAHLAALGIALWIVARAFLGGEFHYFHVLFIPIVAAAVRFGFDGACTALALTQFALVGLLHLYGADIGVFTEFQTLMLVLTATGLIVGVEVSERMRADRLVKAAEKTLQDMRANAAQAARFTLVSGMASALAHEINQPMTAARALMRSAQVLLEAEPPDLPRAGSNLGTAIVQIDHAGGVLRRMRDFLRRGRPHFSTVGTRELIADTLLLCRHDVQARHVHLEGMSEDDTHFAADKVQLQQVILNLVHNAAEAISGAHIASGRVRVSAHRLSEPERIEFRVADNGPGIAQDYEERMFEPLNTSKHEGLGLGLPICAAIVEAHGGRIWLHNGTPGSTEFRFTIPLDQPQGP